MAQLDFGKKPVHDSGLNGPSCACTSDMKNPRLTLLSQPKAPLRQEPALPWVTGKAETPIGSVGRVSTDILPSEHWEHFKCRVSTFRNNYVVPPGLYAVGQPDRNSDVLVSANYKLSFDSLRQELKGLNAWLLVLDTKGINVWCAAGKGTFGTDELVRRIRTAQLDKVVEHRRIILPQLGAPGVSAHRVTRATGFRVLFGPVYAKDVKAYIDAGYKASREMRTIAFTFSDRLVLTPMEIVPAMRKFPLYAGAVLVIFGLGPSGILFREAWTGGLPFLLFGLISVLAGAVLTPLLLPFIPFRSFAIKGWVVGLVSVYLSTQFITPLTQHSPLQAAFTYLFFPVASSYMALQFTGATTFTGMSGVKRELKAAIPLYLIACAVGLVLLAAFKFTEWCAI